MEPQPQHLAALDRANKIRLGRAKIKKDLKSGDTTISELTLKIPEVLETAKLFEIISSMDRWGKYRTRRVLRELGFSEMVTFGALTERQKKLLIEKFTHSIE